MKKYNILLIFTLFIYNLTYGWCFNLVNNTGESIDVRLTYAIAGSAPYEVTIPANSSNNQCAVNNWAALDLNGITLNGILVNLSGIDNKRNIVFTKDLNGHFYASILNKGLQALDSYENGYLVDFSNNKSCTYFGKVPYGSTSYVCQDTPLKCNYNNETYTISNYFDIKKEDQRSDQANCETLGWPVPFIEYKFNQKYQTV